MLFVDSKIAERGVARDARLAVLEALQNKGFVPAIRAGRLHSFERVLAGAERAKELEQSVAERTDAEGEGAYVRGDVFCSEDFAHFLVFGDDREGAATLRAGIVYTAETDEPEQKLEAFCRHVADALEAAEGRATERNAQAADAAGGASAGIEWRRRDGRARELFARFAGEGREADVKPPASARGADERARVVEILEDVTARNFLQRLAEAEADKRVPEMLAAGGGHEPAQEALIARLAGAGLVRREVQVSCRKDGRSLFRLPSPDALAIVTASNAVCSECGAAVADERAEELVTPTPLASSMLKDGAWLSNSLRTLLASLGLPEREVFTRAGEDGEAQVLANVCGEPFRFVLRDGEFTAAHARRALEQESDVQAAHLVVVATGKIQDEARARLRERARRRARAGGEAEVIFVEGLEAAPAELRRALERVAQDALAHELYELDASTGFNVGHMLAARFRLMQRKDALPDLAASAAGALAGSL